MKCVRNVLGFNEGGGWLIKKRFGKGVIVSFAEKIRQAALSRKTIKLKLKSKQGDIAESVEFEPYSKKIKGDKVTFFCLDVESHHYLDVELGAILDAEITSRVFRPRFPVAF